jgi:ADP-ribose pyrophosphatase YjhB (NUDIX family)
VPRPGDAEGLRATSAAVAQADRPVFLYVESDGMVCLVRREGLLTFPREGDPEVPPELEMRGEMDFPEGKVLFAVPRLDAWPREWTFKDDVPARADVAVIVHRAVNASLVREVVGGLVFHPDGKRLLLVKASRGFTKGMWNIPGGFVTYAESPEESMHRELEEETGLQVRLVKLLGVFTQKFGSPYYMRGHMYLAEATGTDLRLQADEIADAQWFTVPEFRRLVMNPFARKALDALDKGKGLALD